MAQVSAALTPAVTAERSSADPTARNVAMDISIARYIEAGERMRRLTTWTIPAGLVAIVAIVAARALNLLPGAVTPL